MNGGRRWVRVTYLVLEDLAVTHSLSLYSDRVRRDYETVKAILSETPRGNPRFSAITEGVTPRGQTFYQYLDGVLPVILQYRVFEPDVPGQRGLVWIASAVAY